MTPEEAIEFRYTDIQIAEYLGVMRWTMAEEGRYPDCARYTEELDEIQKAVLLQDQDFQTNFCSILVGILARESPLAFASKQRIQEIQAAVHASAAHRAEAFVEMINS